MIKPVYERIIIRIKAKKESLIYKTAEDEIYSKTYLEILKASR